MGPVDAIISMEFNTINYNKLYEHGYLTIEKKASLNKFTNSSIFIIYDNLKNSFIDTFDNKFLLEFFKDSYVEV